MAKVTRDDVVERAFNIFDKCGYIWGAWPGTKPTQYCQYNAAQGKGVIASSGYIATDCSGFTSWAWALDYKRGSWSWGPDGEFSSGGKYRARANTQTQTYEALFPGIQKGDVLWRSGHVALYIGNNEIMEASTGKWLATPTGRGMRRTSTNFNFSGFCTFDGTFSVDYNPGNIDINTDNVSDGVLGPNPAPTDMSSDDLYIRFHDRQYLKRYSMFKEWRRI